MAHDVSMKHEVSDPSFSGKTNGFASPEGAGKSGKSKSHSIDKESPGSGAAKRRCVSTACIACRRRKSKCDGNTPSCAACSSVYNTECVYDPNSDHRRKGVYKKDIDNLKTRNSTLQTLIQAILNYPENDVPALVKQIRTCENLDDVAESIIERNNALAEEDGTDDDDVDEDGMPLAVPRFEKELSGTVGRLRLENGSVSFIGGTSNLIFLGAASEGEENTGVPDELEVYTSDEESITSWTEITPEARVVVHLLNMYFTWHYTYFTTLSKSLFWRDFRLGKSGHDKRKKTVYCTPLLVNAMLALGCHFTSWPEARSDPQDSATAGDHFFREAKRLILENDEHEKPQLATVQALALMSVREAGCGREARGWVYSGMSFRMAYDLGLNLDSGTNNLDETEVDARRVTIWGCFLFDKCWSNYLGRQPQLGSSNITAPKFEVFPQEDSEIWMPHTDSGTEKRHMQASRTRAVALQISLLCEISSDLLSYFYNPQHLDKPPGKQVELKKLSEVHTRLEAWRKNLPKEMEPREGSLPHIFVMHMFFQLLYIHLFRPFLKYKPANSPLPAHVSPRKFLIHAAATISKLLRLYRKTYGLRQICNIAVYISHMACTVHVLNLPDKLAARDLAYGLSHLEEISESWICARRTLAILLQVSRRWNIDLPESAQKVFENAEAKFGPFDSKESGLSPRAEINAALPPTPTPPLPPPVTEQAQTPSYMTTSPTTTAVSEAPNPMNGQYFPSSAPLLGTPPPILHRPDGTLSLPPQEVTELSRISNQHHFVMPQTHHAQQQYLMQQGQQGRQQQGDCNSQDRNSSQGGGRRTGHKRALTSPTALFGGVDSLLQDQEWWLRDSHQMFANWNQYEQDNEVDVENAPQSFSGLPPTSSQAAGVYDVNTSTTNGYLDGVDRGGSSRWE